MDAEIRVSDLNDPRTYFWRGKPLSEMDADELTTALIFCIRSMGEAHERRMHEYDTLRAIREARVTG